MHIRLRDDLLSKQRLVFRITLLWATTSSITLLVLILAWSSSLKHQKIYLLPLSADSYVLSDTTYSASYLKDMAEKVIDLRFSFNPQSIKGRYETLSNLTAIPVRQAISSLLKEEQESALEKNVSSAFYIEKTQTNTKQHEAVVSGYLHRSSHHLEIKPLFKKYRLRFEFKQGHLNLLSIQEVDDEMA